jgi:beta-glucuronidase
MIKLINLSLILSLFFSLITSNLVAQQNMANVYGRRAQSLNGKWNAIVDLYDQGRKNQIR